eukprot:5481648-Pleurochrysis_carterae.AAC.4
MNTLGVQNVELAYSVLGACNGRHANLQEVEVIVSDILTYLAYLQTPDVHRVRFLKYDISIFDDTELDHSDKIFCAVVDTYV